MTYTTPQETFWAGEFGDDYIGRNGAASRLDSVRALFHRILEKAPDVRSAVEFGCNIGLNLTALAELVPDVELHAIEINGKAAEIARNRVSRARIQTGSILDLEPGCVCDLAFTQGVMIHLAPAMLPAVYAKLARASRRYVLISEYYNPTPTAVDYRGHSEHLFKRDFAGEFMEAHPEFTLVDYGFVYRRDPIAPLDDITWFLLSR